MDENLKQCFNNYYNPDQTKRDVMKLRKAYQGLNMYADRFSFTNGMARNLIKLKGTIPVPFKGRSYNIPVCIWLMDTHPSHAPMCMVEPTSDMCLKPSKNLDHSGRVYLPYLHNWNGNTSNLLELVQVMIKTFSESPPVYTKSAKRDAPVQQLAAYPTQAYTTTVSGATGNPPYPTFNAVPPSYPHPATQTSTANNFHPVYPPYPTSATSTTAAAYPSYPAASAVSPPYPVQPPSNVPLPAPTYPSAATTLSSTAVISPSNTGTITDEHIRASLMSAIEDKIRRKINEQTALCHDEIEILLQTQRELNQGKNKLDSMFDNLEKEKQSIAQKIQTMKDKSVEIEKSNEKLSLEEEFHVDDAVITTTPLYKQILALHCEDAATEDTIYYNGEALRRGVIDLDVFIKQVRALSRKRLMMKSLLEKCRIKAGLAA